MFSPTKQELRSCFGLQCGDEREREGPVRHRAFEPAASKRKADGAGLPTAPSLDSRGLRPPLGSGVMVGDDQDADLEEEKEIRVGDKPIVIFFQEKNMILEIA